MNKWERNKPQGHWESDTCAKATFRLTVEKKKERNCYYCCLFIRIHSCANTFLCHVPHWWPGGQVPSPKSNSPLNSFNLHRLKDTKLRLTNKQARNWKHQNASWVLCVQWGKATRGMDCATREKAQLLPHPSTVPKFGILHASYNNLHHPPLSPVHCSGLYFVEQVMNGKCHFVTAPVEVCSFINSSQTQLTFLSFTSVVRGQTWSNLPVKDSASSFHISGHSRQTNLPTSEYTSFSGLFSGLSGVKGESQRPEALCFQGDVLLFVQIL